MTIAIADRPALTTRGLPGLDTLRPKEDPYGERKRSDDEHRQADPRPHGRRRHVADGDGKSERVLQQHRGTGERDVSRARRAVRLRDHQFLERQESRVREQHAHARADWRGDAATDEEHADERADARRSRRAGPASTRRNACSSGGTPTCAT